MRKSSLRDFILFNKLKIIIRGEGGGGSALQGRGLRGHIAGHHRLCDRFTVRGSLVRKTGGAFVTLG